MVREGRQVVKMEHMDMPWKAVKYSRDGDWSIIAECASFAWHVATITMYLPGDSTGRATAKAICADHNAALAARKGSK